VIALAENCHPRLRGNHVTLVVVWHSHSKIPIRAGFVERLSVNINIKWLNPPLQLTSYPHPLLSPYWLDTAKIVE